MAVQQRQAVVVAGSSINPAMELERIALFNSSGTQLSVPLQIASNSDAAAATSVVAAGANPTKAEYDALRADYLALRTTVNNLQAKMRTAGILA